jgi:hypothetical protein
MERHCANFLSTIVLARRAKRSFAGPRWSRATEANASLANSDLSSSHDPCRLVRPVKQLTDAICPQRKHSVTPSRFWDRSMWAWTRTLRSGLKLCRSSGPKTDVATRPPARVLRRNHLFWFPSPLAGEASSCAQDLESSEQIVEGSVHVMPKRMAIYILLERSGTVR